MGGIYGNVPALEACLSDAKTHQCESLLFLGDTIGCCGHSDEVVQQLQHQFHVLIAGNHEQQAAAGLLTCGCGYASPEDERFRDSRAAHSPHHEWYGSGV